MTNNKTTPADENHFHSEFGASCAKTWRNCPGAIQAIRDAKKKKRIPENTETEYSKEGTIAHDWAEKVLTKKADISEVPDAIRDAIKEYVNWCNSIVEQAEKDGVLEDPIVDVEVQVPLFYRPEDTGTCDFSCYVPDVWLQLIDYKHGAGVGVSATDNDQLCIYGLSYITDLERRGHKIRDDLKVALAIVQPRFYGYDGPDVWITTVRELKDIGLDIEADYNQANDNDVLDLIPSEAACQFCDLKKRCTVRGKTSFGGLPPTINPFEDFDIESDDENITTLDVTDQKAVLSNIDVSTFTPEQVAFICEHGSHIKKIVDDTIKGEIARLEQGGDIEGMKLIAGTPGHRRWNDEAAAEKLIKGKLGAVETYQAKKIITAPQALKKLNKVELSTRFENKLNGLISKPDGNPKLVPVSHKSPALEFKATSDEFDEEPTTAPSDFEDEDFM